MSTTYLAHHGIRGQRWGIRRFQNTDGTLTDQGRRHYGYGSERHRKGLATENTKQRLKEGATTGALAGIGRGVIGAASLISYASGIGAPVGMAMMAGATYLASSTTRGIITGMTIGGLYGAMETRAGREYIKKNDAGLKEFEIRDLEASKK